MALRLLNGDPTTSSMVEPFNRIGDYVLVEFIGRGGMGEVWLAVKQGTTRPRAIKILLPELAKRVTSVHGFKREADIGMQLALHPSIVGVQEIQEAFIGDPACPERVLYLVLDFVDGVNLRRLAERFFYANGVRLPIPIVVHIIRAMLRALAAAHAHAIGKDALPVVHGDVNPGNVLISSRGHVRVTDFGISRFAPGPTFISRPVGTLPYMAPEQYLGRICPQNDLYAVGAVLHELLTGEPPLPAGGSPRTMERRLLDDPIPPLNCDVPHGLERLRRGLLEKNVDLRIQTALIGLEILATVDKADCQDDLMGIYLRLFGPPRSRLTRYLQAHGDSAGSFVVELLRGRRPTTAEEVMGNSPEHAPGPAGALQLDDDDPEDDGPMPWLEEEEPKTQVHQRPATKLSPTVLLDMPVGTRPAFGASAPTVPEPPPAANEAPSDDAEVEARTEATEPPAECPSPMYAAGPLLEPVDDEDDLDLVTTAPRHAARKPDAAPNARARGLGVYPPRPSHLDDGVPFQLRRPHRGAKKLHVPAEGSKPEPTSDPGPPIAGTVTRPDAGPEQTKPQRSPDTRPDALTKGPTPKLPRPSNDSTVRQLRVAFLAATGLLVLALGIGVVALVFSDPHPTTATSNDPRPAPAAGTGG